MRLARVLKFRLLQVEVLYYLNSENKGWYASLLFAYGKNRCSHDVAQFQRIHLKSYFFKRNNTFLRQPNPCIGPIHRTNWKGSLSRKKWNCLQKLMRVSAKLKQTIFKALQYVLNASTRRIEVSFNSFVEYLVNIVLRKVNKPMDVLKFWQSKSI